MGGVFELVVRSVAARNETQDRAEVFERDGALIVVVADGAGGVGDGASASDAVVATVREIIAERPFDPYDIRRWCEALAKLDVALAGIGETTAIVLVAGPHGIAGASVGDSEAWAIGARCDVLTEQQSRARLGSRRARPVPFHRRALEGVLVVGTDGLFKSVPTDVIAKSCAVGDVEEVAERLVRAPRLRSGGYLDDVAVVVCSPRPLLRTPRARAK